MEEFLSKKSLEETKGIDGSDIQIIEERDENSERNSNSITTS